MTAARSRLALLLVLAALLPRGADAADLGPDLEAPWRWWLQGAVGVAWAPEGGQAVHGDGAELVSQLGGSSTGHLASFDFRLEEGVRLTPGLALAASQRFFWLTLHGDLDAQPPMRDLHLARYVLPLDLQLVLTVPWYDQVLSLGAGPSLALVHSVQTGHLDTGSSWSAGLGGALSASIQFRVSPDLLLGFVLAWDMLRLERVNPILDDGGLLHVVHVDAALRWVR
jgi:hypothetical protein